MKTGLRRSGKLAGGLGLLLALALIASLAIPALAVPQPPHTFRGSVTICGESAEEDTVVSARIDDTEYATTLVDADGNYGVLPVFTVPADDPDTDPEKEGGVDGEWVYFYVMDKLAGQAQFERLGLGVDGEDLDLVVTQVDLTVTSDGCCPITVEYDEVSDTVAAGATEVFTDIPCGTDVQLTAVESDCCVLDEWEVDDSSVAGNPITVTMDNFHTAVATCSVPTYTLTVVDNPEEGGMVLGGGPYPCCTDAEITALPATGWVFVNWTGEGIDEPGSASTTVHIDGHKTVTATFTVVGETYDLMVTSDGCCPITVEGLGTVAPGSTDTFQVLEGTDVTVTADDSDPCCQFDSWSDGEAKSHPIHMDGNKSVTAYCSVLTYDLTVTSNGCCPIDVAYDAFSAQVPAGGSETYTGIPCCTDVTVTADDSDPCCRFDSWSDGEAKSHPIHMDDDKSVTAYCSEPTYDLTVTSDGCCTIDVAYDGFSDQIPAGGSQTYTEIPCNTDVELEAVDPACCNFNGWEVDGGPVVGNPITVTMDDDYEATANCAVPGVWTEIPLVLGWNTFSTPIYLDPCGDTWEELFALSGIEDEDIGAILSYNDFTGQWDYIMGGPVEPLEGYYLKRVEPEGELSISIVPYWDNPDPGIPPRKELATGLTFRLNFIGSPSLEDRNVISAFGDIYLIEGVGYSRVINPEENPNGWSNYYRDDPDPTVVAFRAYWVIMGVSDEPVYLIGSLPPPTP